MTPHDRRDLEKLLEDLLQQAYALAQVSRDLVAVLVILNERLEPPVSALQIQFGEPS